jgi:hypothetical protein
MGEVLQIYSKDQVQLSKKNCYQLQVNKEGSKFYIILPVAIYTL